MDDGERAREIYFFYTRCHKKYLKGNYLYEHNLPPSKKSNAQGEREIRQAKKKKNATKV